MIVTNEFVMLNFPKTGSSFARKAIKQAYSGRNASSSIVRKLLERFHMCNSSITEILHHNIDEKISYGIKGQHGTLRQIPIKYNDKLIMSVARNPISRYKSAYLYRWWEKYPPADVLSIRKSFPHFPDLSFSEYYDMLNLYGRSNRLGNIVPKVELGLHTIQFIQFYFSDPQSVLSKIDDAYIDEEHFRKDMGSIKFLHQENLNFELKTFLLNVGLTDDQVRFLELMKPVNVTKKKRKDGDSSKLELDGGVRNRIIEQDRLLFKIFPEYLPSLA